MQPADRILVALDFASLGEAVDVARGLAPHVGGFKVGLELMQVAGGPQVVAALQAFGRPIFYDAKFHDIPNTVAGAVRAAARCGVAMLNVHALGGLAMMEAAVAAAEAGAADRGVTRPKVLAVTVLTSLTAEDLATVGFDHVDTEPSLQRLVVHLARCALAAGCDGVVASPRDVTVIRRACGHNVLIVTPGVRPTWAAVGDQRRVATPQQAVRDGADYLVVGRPITQPPAGIGNAVAAAQRIAQEIV